ncbi:MAG: hypothetical protein HY810_06445 [Candidatus Omnitrophica bacterium]|nr:hypothetical protein [Candidatus Omnitrophota bacterium]
MPQNIKRNSILNINTNGVTAFTHGFHKYPAKFIPLIPRWAIKKYLNGSESKTVFDPFCGSGTTLVEGILAGHNAIGFDVDPLSSMIAKVKTTRVDVIGLNEVATWLINGIKNRGKGLFKPDCETLEHWFTGDAIKKLSIIRTLINQIPDKFGTDKKTKDIQELLLICFSSIIRRVSNADDESQKTYVSHTKIKEPEEVFALFLSQLNLFIERISKFSEITDPKLASKVVCSSSIQSLTKKMTKQTIDLVVTSPPYIKAIDYIYNQLVELFWIGDLFDMQTQGRQNIKKKDYIGNKHLKKTEFINHDPYNNILHINGLDKKLQKVFDSDKKNGHRHSYVTFKYFADMEKHFSEMAKCLTKGTHYVMVAGDSSVSGIFFETADFLGDLAERNQFRVVDKWGYKIKNRYMRFDRKGRGGIIEIDWVIDFEKK